MSQRLSLARDLLAENAAAFIHIDDNEVFHLGLLMNKIFGEKNFVANVIWQKRYSVPSDHKSIAALHEYLLVYQASSLWQRRFLPRGVEKDKQYRFEDENGVFRPDNYTCNKSAEERPNLYYAITNPNTGDEIWPKTTAVWRYAKATHEENVRKDLVYWGKDGKGKVPAFKRYRHMLRNAEGVVPHTWWGFEEVGHNDEAKKELMAILPEMARAFSTPKPTRLLDRILQIGCDETGWVLDMFAGSGTTGHAVMKANTADGGRRRYVLVSNSEATAEEPEKNLCRDVCAERLRRVAGGYRKADGTEVPGLGGGFAYLRCRRVAAAELLEMEHPAVWTALQLRHVQRVADYDAAAPFQWLELGNAALCYVPRWNKAVVAGLRRRIEAAGAVTLCSWQPALGRQYFASPLVCHEGLPAGLTRPFGLRL
jgi:hypothetical protein